MGYLVFFIVLGAIIFVHELGHLLASKMAGIRVEAFSVGFVGKIFSFTWQETEYRLGWLPLGGYVKPNEEHFRRSAIWRRMLVVVAGITANFIFGFLLLFGLFFAGIDAANQHKSVPFFHKTSVAAQQSVAFGTYILVKNAKGMITEVPQNPTGSLAGPLGIAAITNDAYRHGPEYVLVLVAVLSLIVGFMNLLPIPILDGGALVLLLLEAVRGKPLSARIEHIWQSVGVTLLVALMVVACYADIVRIFLSE